MQALMDGVVLAVHGQNRDAAALRAASVTIPPAITRISLLASAIVLPSSMAARTASRLSVPADAHRTRSASGCDATATSPSRPVPAIVAPVGRQPAQPIDGRAGAHGHDGGPVPRNLGGEELRVLAGREADDLQSIGMRVHH